MEAREVVQVLARPVDQTDLDLACEMADEYAVDLALAEADAACSAAALYEVQDELAMVDDNFAELTHENVKQQQEIEELRAEIDELEDVKDQVRVKGG